MHEEVAGYRASDIQVVAAFDVDRRKVGLDVSQAVFAKPNCTTVFQPDLAPTGATVQMGPVLDGMADHLTEYPEDHRPVVADEEPVDVAAVLKASGAEVLVNYLPVGSEDGTRHYAQAALDAGVGFVNCMPVFVASDPTWAQKFTDAGQPLVGDDIKSQVGATIVHRTLARLFGDRGVPVDRTYQMNTGGNTDFLNMLERKRLTSKKVSKTESVQSQLLQRLDADDIHIGPSDYVPWLKDNKLAFIRLEGRLFGGVPMHMELRLSVEDSPNSAGVAVDAIRVAKVARDKGIAGPLEAVSACTMKHPPQQFPDHMARQMLEDFLDQPWPGRNGARRQKPFPSATAKLPA
jgi:myo-inositol-1-phosphate synthase